jgi:hypothetical protein
LSPLNGGGGHAEAEKGVWISVIANYTWQKSGKNCRVEMAKLKKSPRKVYFGKYFSFTSCGLKKMLYFCPMKKSTQSIA